MKPVYKKRHRFNFKDLLRIGGVIFIYYISILIFVSSVLAIRWLVLGGAFWIVPNATNWWLFYIVFIAPGISALSHLIYSETGWLKYKAFVWLHSGAIIIFVPIIIFIFFR